jgi:hypothetical protein
MAVLRNAKSDANRFAAAERVRSEGDIDLACRLYLRVARRRLASPWKLSAKQRLVELDAEARGKLSDVEKKLADCDEDIPISQLTDGMIQQVADCMGALDELADQYGRVPNAGAEIKSVLAKQQKRPLVRAVLREPEANYLWVAAQELERKGQVCCAFQLLEKAVRQLPAPSAEVAQQRLEQLKADPQIVADAETCRSLQWCHLKYRTAVRVAKAQPLKARKIFQQIVQRSPADSEVHLAAKDQILRLN